MSFSRQSVSLIYLTTKLTATKKKNTHETLKKPILRQTNSVKKKKTRKSTDTQSVNLNQQACKNRLHECEVC